MAQATWISVVAGPVFALNVLPAARLAPLGLRDALGASIWASGLALESLADSQKSQWKRDKDAKRHNEPVCRRNLWSYLRHPNYTGEVTMWIGSYLIASRGLHGTGVYPSYAPQLALASPAFIYLLLRFVSLIFRITKLN